jgi:hypothetical protein
MLVWAELAVLLASIVARTRQGATGVGLPQVLLSVIPAYPQLLSCWGEKGCRKRLRGPISTEEARD